MTWGRLAASWMISTLLVALVFTLLAAGGFIGGVAVALIWIPGQGAILVGLAYSARISCRTS